MLVSVGAMPVLDPIGNDRHTAFPADERTAFFIPHSGFTMAFFIDVISANARILDELIAQKLSATVKARADGANRAIDELCDLFVGKSFDVAKNHDGAEILRQRFHGFREIVIEQIPIEACFHIVRIGVFRANGVVEILDVLVINFIWLFRLLTVNIDVGVLHDAEKPRFAVRAGFEFVPETIGFHVGLLEEIVGIVRVAGHAQREIKKRVDVRHRLAFEVAMSIPYSFFV